MGLEVAAVAVGVGLAWPGAAQGQAPEARGWRLYWEAPGECPGATAVRGKVEAALGDLPGRLEGWVVDGAVDTVLEGDAEAYRLELRSEHAGEVGVRSIVRPTCEEVVDAAVVILALGLGPAPSPDGSAAEDFDGSLDGKAVRRDADGPEPSPEPPPTPPDPRRPPSGLLGVAGVADLGVLPNPAFGPGMGGGAVLGNGPFPVELRLDVHFLPEQSASLGEELPGAGVDLRAFGVTPAACAHAFRGRRWALGPCLAVGLTTIWGGGRGVTDPRDVRTLWVLPEVRAFFRALPVPWLGLRADAGAAVILGERAFTLTLTDNVVPVFEADLLAVRFTLAVELVLDGAPESARGR